MRSGRSLWNELVHQYYTGADSVKQMGPVWNKMQAKIDFDRFILVQQYLAVQLTEVLTWRDACVLYFQTFSKMPIGSQYIKPEHPLSYYKDLKQYYVPGIGGNNYMTN